MTSGRRTVRVPAPSDLHAEPPLGPLLFLELVAAVAATALRAHHVAIEGAFFPRRPPAARVRTAATGRRGVAAGGSGTCRVARRAHVLLPVPVRHAEDLEPATGAVGLSVLTAKVTMWASITIQS
jgi:hypothetical protein